MSINIDSLEIDFENCYGIKKLQASFNFIANNCNCYVIYSPNGTMKTSFAKTCSDFAQKEKTKDVVFPEKTTKRIISKKTTINTEATDVNPEEIFVVEPYNETFEASNLSNLLVNNQLKKITTL